MTHEKDSSEKTVETKFSKDAKYSLISALRHFRDSEKVTVGFNCKTDSEGNRLYQCIVSNFSDLMSEADLWSAGIVSEIRSQYQDTSYTIEQYYDEYPESIA